MKSFLQDQITELSIRPQPEESSIATVDVPQFVDGLLTSEGNKGFRREKIVSSLSNVGMDAKIEKVPVTVHNPNNPDQTYTYEQEEVVGIPTNVREILIDSLTARQQNMAVVLEAANKMLPGAKERLIKGLTAYAERLGFDGHKVGLTLSERLEQVGRFSAKDWVFGDEGPIDFFEDAGASYIPRSNMLTIRPHNIYKSMVLRKANIENILEASVLHELEHAASLVAINADRQIARTGLTAVIPTETGWRLPIKHGDLLLDEGTQEHILWKAKLKNAEQVSYMQSVMSWEAAIALDPSIEADRFDAKYLNSPGVRGRLVGKLENLFGPLAVEAVEELINENARLRDFPDFKDELVGLLPEDKRQKARAVLDMTQLEIFTPMDLGYSDEQLRDFKKTGIKPSEPAHAKQS